MRVVTKTAVLQEVEVEERVLGKIGRRNALKSVGILRLGDLAPTIVTEPIRLGALATQSDDTIFVRIKLSKKFCNSQSPTDWQMVTKKFFDAARAWAAHTLVNNEQHPYYWTSGIR